MFEVKNLSLRLNDRYLVENLSFVLNQGDKMALIGEEGNGKSTFLKSILSQALSLIHISEPTRLL